MSRFAEPMTRLIDELKKLPGIGTKSAQRLAFHVLRSSDADARALADAILVLREKLHLCSICNNITDVDPCGYCTGSTRDQHIICVVEEPTNIATIEKTRSYNGVYHVPAHGTLPHRRSRPGTTPHRQPAHPARTRLRHPERSSGSCAVEGPATRFSCRRIRHHPAFDFGL